MTQNSGKINYPSWRAVDMCELAAGSGLWNLWNRRQQRWWEDKETTSLGKWDQGQRGWDSKACGRWCSPSLWPCGHNLPASPLSTQRGSQGAPGQLPSLSPSLSGGILGLSAGRGLWWAAWWRLGTAEDSREQDMPTSCGAGRSLNACFDGLGCLRLPKIFHSREIIFVTYNFLKLSSGRETLQSWSQIRANSWWSFLNIEGIGTKSIFITMQV